MPRRESTAAEWAEAVGHYRTSGAVLLGMGVLALIVGASLWLQDAPSFLSGPMVGVVGLVFIGTGWSFSRMERESA